MSKAELFTDRLEFCKRVSSDKWMARCPAHKDNSPSLSVKELSDGRVLIHCHAGCGATDVLDAVGMEWGDLYPDEGEYSPVIRKREKDSYSELFVAIAKDAMSKGQRLTEAEKQQYIQAKLRTAI